MWIKAKRGKVSVVTDNGPFSFNATDPVEIDDAVAPAMLSNYSDLMEVAMDATESVAAVETEEAPKAEAKKEEDLSKRPITKLIRKARK